MIYLSSRLSSFWHYWCFEWSKRQFDNDVPTQVSFTDGRNRIYQSIYEEEDILETNCWGRRFYQGRSLFLFVFRTVYHWQVFVGRKLVRARGSKRISNGIQFKKTSQPRTSSFLPCIDLLHFSYVRPLLQDASSLWADVQHGCNHNKDVPTSLKFIGFRRG